MLEKLSGVLRNSMDRLASAIFVDKKLVDSIIKDLQRALIESDVAVTLVKQISDELRAVASSESIKGVDKKEQIIKLLHDKILSIIGGEKKELKLARGDRVVLIGLYGSGKTTTTNKLAYYYSKRGFKSAIVGLDVHRPAASEQLEQLGKNSKIRVFVDASEKNPSKIIKKFKSEFDDYDLLFFDTAGRHDLDGELIEELKVINKEVKPTHVLLVIPADIGQVVKRQAQEFKKSLDISGVIVTRMDSSAKGGGALSACSQTGTPVYFITTGEKLNDLEVFNPENFVSRILGMGDLEALLDKVKSSIDENSQKKSLKRLEEGKFNLLDLYEQIKAMQSMGSLSKITSLIPGFSKAKIPEEMLGSQENKIKKWKNIIDSMTPEEIDNPAVLDKQKSRISRIAHGAGSTVSDVKALLKQYDLIKEFSSGGMGGMEGLESGQLSREQMQKIAKKFGKKVRM
ncbi:MAG: signal recognition particle receptor subunit alpha [Nanoarchaeota archaeon]